MYLYYHFTVLAEDWELKPLSQGHSHKGKLGEPSSTWSQSLRYTAWTEVWALKSDCLLLGLCPLDKPFLNISFLMCEMGLVIAPTSDG